MRLALVIGLRGGGPAGYISLREAASQAMLTAPAGRLASAVQSRYHLAFEVEHLALHVDSKASIAIVGHDRGPGGVERRDRDLEGGRRLLEVRIDAKFDHQIVSGDGGL